MYAREKDIHQLRVEKHNRQKEVAALLSFDYEGPELARFMVKNRSKPIRVKGGNIYFGRRRSEMATRAFQVDPIAFTEAAHAAGCAVLH
jgi:hypothetical protein